MTSTIARGISAGILLLMLLVYWGGGPVVQIWPDSDSYLWVARDLVASRAQSDSGRSIGYPLMLAAALATPAPLLVTVLAQAAIAAGALAALYLALTRHVMPALAPAWAAQRRAHDVVLVLVSLTALYSLVHVHVAGVLTETLFTTVALAAVLAAMRAAGRAAQGRPAWSWTAVTALLAGTGLAIKPHWLVSAWLLALGCGILLAATVRPRGGGRGARLVTRGLVTRGLVRRGLALALPLVVLAVTTIPDRLVALRAGDRAQTVFTARTMFCNHLHLIDDALKRQPQLRLADDPAVESLLREHMQRIVAKATTGWRLLGFNGDSCTYDRPFNLALDRALPEPRRQSAALLGATRRAILAAPWPYIRKVAAQVAYGFTLAFARFAHHATAARDEQLIVLADHGGPERLARGVALAETTGPLGSPERMKGTLAGRVLAAVLAAVFLGANVVLCLLVLATLLVAPVLWRSWSAEWRWRFVVHLGLPLAAMLGHHGVVALSHTFDVWRYGFNMYWVNLLFLGAAAMFWAEELRRRRGGGAR